MRLGFLIALYLLGGNLSVSEACSCRPSAPCESFSNADVVFSGEVTGSKYPRTEQRFDLDPSNDKPAERKITYETGEIYFDVIKVYKGDNISGRITVHSTMGGGDCGAVFERGRKYVIFASREGTPKDPDDSFYRYRMGSQNLQPNPSRLWTSLCAGNRDLEVADEALEYLKNLPTPGGGGSIEGKVYESIRDYSSENISMKPYANATVRVSSIDANPNVTTGVTDEKGNFRIKVPAGDYKLALDLPVNLRAAPYDGDEGRIAIMDMKCAVRFMVVGNNSQIAGELSEIDGSKRTGLSLDLVPAAIPKDGIVRSKQWAYVQEGLFDFSGVPIGKYYLCLNCTDKPDDDAPYPRWYYPGTSDRSAAKVFSIELGTQFKGLGFRLPPKLAKVPFSGQVLWKDGKPAGGAEVQMEDTEANDRDVFFDRLKTDKAGVFRGEWFAGRRYRLKVVVWKMSPDGSGVGIADAETKEFILDKATPAFRIVLNSLGPRIRVMRRSTVRTN